MPKIAKVLLLGVSVALVLTVFLGVNASGVSAASAGQEGAYRQINVYTQVLQHIENEYVTDPNIPEVTNGALRGLLGSAFLAAMAPRSLSETPSCFKATRASAERSYCPGWL